MRRQVVQVPCDPPEWKEAIASLPYGKEILFVDRIVDVMGRTGISTEKCYELSQVVVADHASLGGTVPGFALSEQAAQSALLLGILAWGSIPGEARLVKSTSYYLAPIIAPETVKCDLSLEFDQSSAIRFDATLKVARRPIAKVLGNCKFAHV